MASKTQEAKIVVDHLPKTYLQKNNWNKNKVLQQENDFLKRVRSINRKQITKQLKNQQERKKMNLLIEP